jgi:hypothetical protein
MGTITKPRGFGESEINLIIYFMQFVIAGDGSLSTRTAPNMMQTFIDLLRDTQD